MYVYVASSWRCAYQPFFIEQLIENAIPNYDFRNPPTNTGFGWQEVMGGWDINSPLVSPNQYVPALDHPRAVEGFASDMQALDMATHVVLVLPCNRSAHLELGYAVGQGKKTAIILEDPCEPELMYKMVDFMTSDADECIEWLEATRGH